MAFPSITDFKAQLLDGGARPSLFEMALTFPVGLGGSNEARDKMRFHCRISEIPGTQHNPITIKFAGREIKYAGQRVFNNLTLTILNDEGFTVRRALERWFEAMNTSESNVSLLSGANQEGVVGTYAGQGTVTQYNKQGAPIRAYMFVDLFPVTLAPIALDWSNDGAIEDYTCEFAYQYWEAAPVSQAGAIARAVVNAVTV